MEFLYQHLRRWRTNSRIFVSLASPQDVLKHDCMGANPPDRHCRSNPFLGLLCLRNHGRIVWWCTFCVEQRKHYRSFLQLRRSMDTFWNTTGSGNTYYRASASVPSPPPQVLRDVGPICSNFRFNRGIVYHSLLYTSILPICLRRLSPTGRNSYSATDSRWSLLLRTQRRGDE